MANLTIMWIVMLQLMSSALADVSHLEYSIKPSSQLAYYHYPAPSRPVLQRGQRTQYQQSQQYPQVARQFAEPALEQAAFTQALTSQGYVFGAPSAPLQVAPSAVQTQQVARPAIPAGSSAGRSLISNADANSLNLKLPVPFGITPLNVAQLPLQAGAPYASVPRTTGLTSYGTPQIQRR
ncbi:uncharacterized protein LOC108089320 [Drosophila ficusphila]|uniref:uncharacterized protein LOC108089320 n=1 Tax=Drosophila ficusphila TaxID=30025 RepID=UPI0007E7212C|nr:uncharacterized protein LOC108089320 [Drosophila ficusphila]